MSARPHHQMCTEDYNWPHQMQDLTVTSVLQVIWVWALPTDLRFCLLRSVSERERVDLSYRNHTASFRKPSFACLYVCNLLFSWFSRGWLIESMGQFFSRAVFSNTCDIPLFSWILTSVFIPYQGLFAPGSVPPMAIIAFLPCVHAWETRRC